MKTNKQTKNETQHLKSKIIASSPISSWQTEGEKVKTVTNFIFLGSKITVDGDCSHEMKRHLLLGRKAMTRLSSVQFSCSVMADSLRPHESQHSRPPCPSPTPGVQTHIHPVGDAIQPSHPLSSPSPPAPNPSQHQSLFQ